MSSINSNAKHNFERPLSCLCLGHLLLLLQGVLCLLALLHQLAVLRVLLPPAEGVEHVEEGHGDVDEYYEGKQRV